MAKVSPKSSNLKTLSAKKRQELANAVAKKLATIYPMPSCALIYHSPFQLLVATILSAQCTDKRVNEVTPVLFERLSQPRDFANASLETIENLIRTCGFFHSKALHIKEASQMIVDSFDGKVPQTMEELVSLPGVGRKTANCVLGNAFGIAEGFVVDTHVIRLSRKIGLSEEKTPEKIEKDLIKLFPEEERVDVSHRLILLGRQYCIARRPKCGDCPLAETCLKRD